MEFTFPLPQHLDKSGVLFKQWNSFSQRFHSHQKSFLPNSGGSKTPSILLFAASHHLDKVSQFVQNYDLDPQTLAQLLATVEEICLPLFLLLFERFRYFTLEQDNTETLNEFISCMRKQIDLCEFGDTKDSIIASSLAVGESVRQSSHRLCLDDVHSVDTSPFKRNDSAISNSGVINFPALSSDMITCTPSKKRDLRSQPKSSATHSPEESMFIVPLNGSFKDDMESDDDFLETVMSSVGEKCDMKLKKKSRIRQQTGANRPKVFLCFKCDNEYATRKSFRRHIASKHADCKEYYCKHCQKAFHNRSQCITHCMGHNTSPTAGATACELKVDNSEYLCWYCGDMLPNLIDYKKHCLTHSAVKVFYCDLCQRKNHTLHRMIGHLKGHLSPRHRCEICANCFGRAELLEAHMLTHAAQPVHQCQVCFKNFVSADRLQGHMKTHSGEKRFTCELCGKSFCQKMSLDYHKRVHAGEKPYECDICGTRTASFGYLRQHKQMHSDKRPYVCEVCGKSFHFISSLTRHRNGHTGKRAFACDVCGRAFIYREGLRDHIKASRCPGRKQEVGTKCPPRAPRSKSSHLPNSAVNSGQNLVPYTSFQQAPETLVNELPHWQYMLRNSEPDGTEGLVVVPQYY